MASLLPLSHQYDSYIYADESYPIEKGLRLYERWEQEA